MKESKYISEAQLARIEQISSEVSKQSAPTMTLGFVMLWLGAVVTLTAYLGAIGFAGAVGLTGVFIIWQTIRSTRAAAVRKFLNQEDRK